MHKSTPQNSGTSIQLNHSLSFTSLEEGIAAMGKTLTSNHRFALTQHFTLIQEASKVTNLTSVTDWETASTRHFLDSLSVFLAFEKSDVSNPSVLDVGSGAGFPGIPIKVFHPESRVDMIESRSKKAIFLQKVIDSLELTHTSVYTDRAESLAHSTMRESYDIVVARAVAPMNVLVELTLPFVRKGGIFIAMKQLDIRDELQRALTGIQRLGGIVSTPPIEVDLPNLSPKRSLVIIDKAMSTPHELPRNAGTPRKRPLS
tara:strand:- start:1583 stop:2359 length:777 start_codon:yes stop_codon:yes gene_type:complete